MIRRAFLFAALAAIALLPLTAAQPASAKLGDRMNYVVYSDISTKTWVTWYKTETFGNRKIISSGWMEPRKWFKQEIIQGNTYYVRGEVMDEHGKKIYDTTAQVEIGPGHATSKTLKKGNGNCYWQ
jgi:Fe-S cluster biosynthesis and repair protein YggX